jgi:hypothetical protein
MLMAPSTRNITRRHACHARSNARQAVSQRVLQTSSEGLARPTSALRCAIRLHFANLKGGLRVVESLEVEEGVSKQIVCLDTVASKLQRLACGMPKMSSLEWAHAQVGQEKRYVLASSTTLGHLPSF